MKIQSFIIFLGVFNILQVEGQSNNNQTEDVRTARATIDNQLPDMSESALNSGKSIMKINAGTDKKTAFIRLKSDFIGNTNIKWNLSVEAPYDEDNDPTILGDFDGLSNISNISFDMSGIKPIKFFDNIKQYTDWKLSKCNDLLELNTSSPNWNKGCTEGQIKAHNKGKGLDDNSINELINAYQQERLNKYLQLVQDKEVKPVKAIFYGLTLKTGYKDYKFRNIETFDKENSNKTSWSLSTYLNYVIENKSIGIGANIQKSHQESDEVQLCTPLDQLQDSLTCSNVRIGSPIEQKRKILYFLMSYSALNQKFATQPKISYDFEEDEVGVTVPIFLFKDKSNNFQGGLHLSWQSEDNDFVAGVFVGRKFELF